MKARAKTRRVVMSAAAEFAPELKPFQFIQEACRMHTNAPLLNLATTIEYFGCGLVS